MSVHSTEGRLLQTDTDSEITLTLTPRQAFFVNQLIEQGLWGNTARQCVSRLVDTKLQELLLQNILKAPKK